MGRVSRLIRTILAVSVVLLAKPALSTSLDGEVLEITQRSEALLNKVEYERARELLESSVRDPRYRRVRPATKARLWALLGRARAELGDDVGTDEAFLQSVMWDRRVRLSKSTSPKILEALERARANAPLPGQSLEGVDDTDPPAPGSTDPPRPDRTGSAETPPGGVPQPKKPPVATVPAGRVPRNDSAKLVWRLSGSVEYGRTVILRADVASIPGSARIEAMVRRALGGSFVPVQLIRTGTVASLSLNLDRPRIEIFLRATDRGRTLAHAGSDEQPIVISTIPPAPPIREAWSTRETSSTENDKPRQTADPRLLPSGPAAPTEIEITAVPASTSTGAIMDVAMRAAPPSSPDVLAQNDTTLYVLIGGGAVLIAGTLAAILLFGSGSTPCDVMEGFGCAEIQIRP